jgi:hypothetical protein
MTPEKDKVIWRHDLPGIMMVRSNTVSKWIRAGRFPKPDVAMTRVRFGWRLSTLRQHGVNLP